MTNNKGFTLIEIVISMAIVSISLVTLLTVFNRSLLSSANNSILTHAVMLADERMALVSSNPSLISDGSWTKDSRYPGYLYKQTITPTPLKGASSLTVAVRHGAKNIFSLQNYLVKNEE